MTRHEDKEAAVRRLLDTPHPPVPGDLAGHAVERGSRMRRRNRAARRVAWTLFALAVLAFVLWASVAQPWEVPAAETTPPFDGV
ncbi:hypothetical protein OG462_27515 [Streptomyces sp. NBC_01077]|uniref:hypothetical protein n=1 Tax=Streptomyces sp. NBC_01077 TaxID=2903746 RepID=UPI0038685F6D|nr:hypothetical protein OG462_27515 [Streptomyces sp. NBC_01077]